MAWLLRQGEVLASVDVAASPNEGLRGIRATESEVSVVLCRDARIAHTFHMVGGVDLAWMDDELVVRRTCHLGSFGLRLAARQAHVALFAESGAFDRWGLSPGDALEVKD